MIDSEMIGNINTDKNTRPENVAPIVGKSTLHVLGVHGTEAVLETLLDIHLSLVVIDHTEPYFQLIMRVVQRKQMGFIGHCHDRTASPQDILRKK